jgi:hypothetical protein
MGEVVEKYMALPLIFNFQFNEPRPGQTRGKLTAMHSVVSQHHPESEDLSQSMATIRFPNDPTVPSLACKVTLERGS